MDSDSGQQIQVQIQGNRFWVIDSGLDSDSGGNIFRFTAFTERWKDHNDASAKMVHRDFKMIGLGEAHFFSVSSAVSRKTVLAKNESNAKPDAFEQTWSVATWCEGPMRVQAAEQHME